MAKVRVYELAKEFGVESKAVMDQLKEMGEFVRSASSTIEAPVVRRLKEAFSTKGSDQPAQGNQGGQGSRPKPGGQAAPRDGAPAGGAKPRPGAGAVPAPQGARDVVRYCRPRHRARRDANGSRNERLRLNCAATGTTSAPDGTSCRGPAVVGLPAYRTRPQEGPSPPRVPGAATGTRLPRPIPQPGRGSGDGARPPAQRPARQAARPARVPEPSGSGRSGFQAVRAPAAGTWCSPPRGAQARRSGFAFRCPASRPQAR